MRFSILVSFSWLLLLCLSSCDNEVKCPALKQGDFTDYSGSFESYGVQLTLLSSNSDSLKFNLIKYYSEPYTCKSSYMKECLCKIEKELKDDLPPGSEDDFLLEISSETSGDDPKFGGLQISINDFRSYFHLDLRSSETEIEIHGGFQYFSTDTTINSKHHSKVVVGRSYETHPEAYIILSRDEGLVGFKDTTGVTWYRQFQ